MSSVAFEGLQYAHRLVADRVRFSSGLHLNFSLISIITAGFIFGIYDGYLSTPLLLGWSIGLIVVVLLEMGLYTAYLFYEDSVSVTTWERMVLLLNLLSCLGIGCGIWLVAWGGSDLFLPINILILVYAVLLYGMHLFNVRIFVVCLLGLLLPAILFYALNSGAEGIFYMMAFILVGLMLSSCAVISSQYFRSSALNHYRVEELSKKIAAEKEISEIALALAEAANRDRAMFFAAANHDLRQPLHAIGLLLETLRLERKLPSSAKSVVEQMMGSVNTLAQMFNHFLDINRMETGGLSVSLQTFPLQSVFNDLMREYGLQAAEKGLQLRMSMTDVQVHTDRLLLARILGNLIGNAITYTDQGVVWLGYRKALQSIEVRDSGRGIAVEHQDDIFKDFFQVQQATQVGRQGYGLGLPIVRRLANILHLSIGVSSALGRGSVFRLSMPAVVGGVAAERLPLDPQSHQEDMLNDVLRGKRILLIDGDNELLQRMAYTLSAWGVEVRAALNSHGALSAVSSLFAPEWGAPNVWRPDLIITDYQVGRQIWVELVLNMRSQHGRSVSSMNMLEAWYCPVIFLAEDPAVVPSIYIRKGSVIVQKPVKEQDLREAAVKLLCAPEVKVVPDTFVVKTKP